MELMNIEKILGRVILVLAMAFTLYFGWFQSPFNGGTAIPSVLSGVMFGTFLVMFYLTFRKKNEDEDQY